jgi:hypothetical protein
VWEASPDGRLSLQLASKSSFTGSYKNSHPIGAATDDVASISERASEMAIERRILEGIVIGLKL